MYSKKSVGLIAVLVIAFLCANVGIGIECVEAAPNGSLGDDLFDPVIVSVEQSNDSPGQGEDVTITAHVIDIVGVSSVKLIYIRQKPRWHWTAGMKTTDTGREPYQVRQLAPPWPSMLLPVILLVTVSLQNLMKNSGGTARLLR